MGKGKNRKRKRETLELVIAKLEEALRLSKALERDRVLAANGKELFRG